mgnify:CR=1 FL=1
MWPVKIDKFITEKAQMPMGPFRVADMSGLDTVVKVAVDLVDGFGVPPEPKPDETNAQRSKTQPGNNAPFWRGVRDSNIDPYQTSQVRGPETQVLIQSHLQECVACRLEAASLAELSDALRAMATSVPGRESRDTGLITGAVLERTFNAGERVALVGPTGSGKTTCASLLSRFYRELSVNLMMQVIRGGKLEGGSYLPAEHRAIVDAYEAGDPRAACAAIRLARFNVSPKDGKFFSGVPTTVAAAVEGLDEVGGLLGGPISRRIYLVTSPALSRAAHA